jgi:hypothetical protein
MNNTLNNTGTFLLRKKPQPNRRGHFIKIVAVIYFSAKMPSPSP